MARSSRRLGLALALAALVLALDQASKSLVRREAAGLPWRIVEGLRLDLAYNSGFSFSRFAGSDFVIVVVGAVCAAVATALWLSAPRYRLALGAILGGALGNLVDRLRFGAVVDFIGVYSWPTFNIGDVAIVAGTALLVLQVLRAGAR